MIECKNISKKYNLKKENEVEALKSLDLVLPDKGMVFLVGESGSGKTTLLNIMSSIEKPSSGELIVDGKTLSGLKENKLDKYRNEDIGIIFQNYNLLQDETVASNINLALELQGRKKFLKSKYIVDEVLEKVGLNGYGDRKITQLSGGQQQRVAIARALIKSPKIIFADEPTGNLDSETSESIMELFKDLSDSRLVVIVCHDLDLANKYADRIITLKDGSIEKDEVIRDKPTDETGITQQEEKKKAKHLSIARQLKFAFKNLWAIKFRLIVVIVLLGISIAAAGVGGLTSRYDRQDTRAKAYYNSGLGSLLIREQGIYELDEYNNPIEQTGFMKQKLMDEKKIAGLEEISAGEYYRIYGTSDHLHETMIVTGDFSRLNEFGFKVIKGSYPQRAGEVAVSISWAESRGAEISSDGEMVEDIIGEDGIVGIIDCDETKLTKFAEKVYSGSGQKEMLEQMYLKRESDRGRTKLMFVMEEDMDKYRDNFDVYNRVGRYYVYKDKDKTESPYEGWDFLRCNMPDDELGWHRGFEWENADCIQMKEVNEKIGNNEIRNFEYIGKNPNDLEEDEIVLTFLSYYNKYDEDMDLEESILTSIVVNAIQKEKGTDYNVTKEEMFEYIANNAIECEIQFHTNRDPEVYTSNWVTITKKFKIVGAVFADWYNEDYYFDNPDFKQQFIYSDKLDMLKVAFNNYGLIGYVANIGNDLEKDRELLDYCEANNLDYNGIMNPYLEDADKRAEFLQEISVALTLIFSFISIIIFTNLTLISMQKTKKQVGLLRAMGSGAADNIGIYILQGLICGIMVAIVGLILFPMLVNICASGSGLNVLEPIFKGVSDLLGNYSPYLNDMIEILPVNAGDYICIGIVSILTTIIFTIMPLLFRLKQKPIELLREEGDL